MYKAVKRFFDIVIAAFTLIALSWLLIPCMIILLFSGEHYIFYYQKRRGYRNQIFDIIKFATMLLNSPRMNGGTITVRNDPRVLPFGKFLRRTKINELPQIFNVLNGTMSIVGPRPLVEEGFELYSEDVRKILYENRPGITGIGSVVFRDEECYLSRAVDPKAFYREKIMSYKGALEIWYHDHISIITDIKIIILTALIILFPQKDLTYLFFPSLPPRPDWMQGKE